MFRHTKLCTGLAIAFGSLAIAPGAVMAQDASLQRVEITGSSIKRVAAESALPVTTMTKDDISKSGVTSVEALLATITSASTAGATQGSALAGLASYGYSSVSLRGLGEQRTLVLVNGKRMATFAGTGSAVDVNSIPLSAIEKVEILRDGASGVYGSDAVAGVVNFILRQDYNGLEATASYDDPTRGGGGTSKKVSILFGKGNLAEDRYNIMLSADYEQASALFGHSRNFAASGNVAPYFQAAATETGAIQGIWIPGQTQAQNARTTTNPYGYSSSGYGNPMAPNNCGDIGMFSSGKGGVGGAFDNCKYDPAGAVGLFPAVDRTNLLGSVKFQVNRDMQLYADALYAQNKVTETYQSSPVKVSFLSSDNAFAGSGVDPALLIFPSNPNYAKYVSPYLQANGLGAMDGKPLAVTLRTFLTGGRQEQDTNTQSRLNIGVKGNISDWDYDVGLTSNQSKTEGMLTDGYFSQLGLATILNNPANNWNPFATGGVQDPALTAKLQGIKYVGPTITAESKNTSIDGVVSGTIATLPAGPLQMAAGLTVRHETYQVAVPAILGLGDIAGLGGATPPEDAARTTSSVFAELNVPIVKTLEGNLAARGDRYSDVGSTANGKASLRYTPTSNMLFRGSVGTGFRAPTLVELHKPQTVGTTEQFIDPLHAADGAIQANALIGGNPDLKPEKSKQFGLGMVLQATSNFSIGLDYFNITIDNMIANPSALALVNAVRAGKPLYGANDATFAPDGTVDTVNQTLRNADSVTVSGIDVDLRYKQAFSAGKLTLGLNGTYTDKYDYKTLAGTQHSVGTIVQPDGSPLTIAPSGVVVRWKHNLSMNWATGPWSTTVAQNYTAGYRDANDLNGDQHNVPGFSTYDAQVAYSGVKNLTLTLGARNLFDKNPPLFIGNGTYFGYGFDPTQYDARARTVYFRANYKFM